MTEKKPNPQNQIFEIPADGSLGLLALGAVGLKAWRKKRDEGRGRGISENKKDESEGIASSENKSSTENNFPTQNNQ